MASIFRNLVLIALICAFATSLSISHNAYQQRNVHRVRVQQISHRQPTITDDSSFATNIQSAVDTISTSVQPDVPSIIETKNLPTFAFSRNTCQSLTGDQKTSILEKVTSAKDSITSFKSGVTDEKISADADNSFRYLSIVQQLVNKNCDDITTYLLVGPTPYQTNIITDQAWILGGLTMDDVSKDYINRITTFNNATNCGSSTPFWDGFKCISCSEPTPVFNIATGKCDVCPDGTVYDSATHSCKQGGPKNYKPNVAGQPHILVPDESEEGALDKYMNAGKQPCPESTPFVKDNNCISCPEDKPYFNLLSKECESCPDQYFFEESTHKCVQGTPNATDVPAHTPRLVMNDDSTNEDWDNYVKQNENKIFCPNDKPFWTGEECIQCPALFNIITRKCMECEEGFALHADTHKCEPAEPLEPYLVDLFNAIF